MKKLFLIAIATSLFAVTGAAAQGNDLLDRTEDREYSLEPTSAGHDVEASGIVVLSREITRDGEETLAIRIVGRFRDGTVLPVTVNTRGSEKFVGSITIRLGSGYLRLSDLEPSAAFPLDDLRRVSVWHGRRMPILEAKIR